MNRRDLDLRAAINGSSGGGVFLLSTWSEPTINKNPFPDFILGDNDGKSSNKIFINSALTSLKNSDFNVTHNTPFKGGYLTRSKGDKENNINALQLEMSKDLYMSNNDTKYDNKKADKIKNYLENIFKNIINFTF